ncbi:MAG: phenylalanine--tRNA ligase subunit beta [Gemmataceae bacterium]
MKIPLRWLAEYVELPESVAHLAERLTIGGLEVESAEIFGLPTPEGLRVKQAQRGPVWAPEKMVIAEITEIKQHPDADKLKLPIVEYGADEPKQLVTGAPNISVGESGQKVVLALEGSEFIDNHGKEPAIKTLKPTKLRGIPSDAMVCSYAELGINDDHGGIILLEEEAPVGMSAAEFMGEVVLEADVLPNMARCLSMVGIAREVAAITSKSVSLPSHEMKDEGDPIEGQVKVEIEDPKLCPRYMAVLLKDVTIGEAPGPMQRHLMFAGMRPISNIVDITNFVMLEWGQPLHAFDYDKLVERADGKAPTIIIRPAKEGEVLKTLDDVDRELTPENLVIADIKGPIALAGVMGGAETEVSEETKNILLESASFDGVSIRKTAKKFNLHSEASTRFSRGIHPDTVEIAAGRAAELMRKHAGATICKGTVDNYPAKPEPQIVQLRMSEVKRLLGIDVAIAEAQRILEALEFGVEQADEGTLEVTVPPHRLDIQAGEADLIEDLARIHGYDKLPATLMSDRLPLQQTNEPLVFEERVRDILVRLGLQEAITYSLTTPEREAILEDPTSSNGSGTDKEYVRLLNPISNERVAMRQSVLNSLIEVGIPNTKTAADVRLFEIGRVYLPKENENLPEERTKLAIFVMGKRTTEFWTDSSAGTPKPESLDFFDLKGIIEAFVADLHLQDVSYKPSKVACLHPARAAELHVGDKLVGYFGQLNPRLAGHFDFDTKQTILVVEFDLETLRESLPPRFSYSPVPRFPANLRDIAILVDSDVTAEQMETEIRTTGGDILRDVWLFDVYTGENIPEGKKSVAYALTYGAEDRTLKDKDVDKVHKKIEAQMKKAFEAQIRGKE